MTRTYAVQTPKLGQNRKAAATRDALDRRGLRVTTLQKPTPGKQELGNTTSALNAESVVLAAILALLTLSQEFRNASTGILRFSGAKR